MTVLLLELQGGKKIMSLLSSLISVQNLTEVSWTIQQLATKNSKISLQGGHNFIHFGTLGDHKIRMSLLSSFISAQSLAEVS